MQAYFSNVFSSAPAFSSENKHPSLTPSYKRWCRTGEMCGMHPVTIIQNRHLPQLLQLTVAACFVYSNSIRLPFLKPGEIHRGNCP